MDATTTLLKCLKSKRIISDIEAAKNEVQTDIIKLKRAEDLFIRDAITGLGTILKEDLEKHYYVTSVKVGLMGNVLAYAIIQRNNGNAELVVYAHEGLIKQNLTGKAIVKLKKALY